MAFRGKIEKEFEIDVLDASDKHKDEIWFSVGSNNSSKGMRLLKNTKYLEISLKNAIAIGNDYNDISMFEIAGISVAVDNATDDIKNHVDIVTESNDNDGVGRILGNYYLKYLILSLTSL